jgi:hypothetical protein
VDDVLMEFNMRAGTYRLLAASFILLAIFATACSENKPENLALGQQPWWKPLTPDLILGSEAFYAKRCAITQVSIIEGIETEKIIFTVPARLFATCKNADLGAGVLEYDGKFLIFAVCQMSFGAGGCPGERYRSADFTHWQKEIGVTWIKGEQYEAWIVLGSSSSKADIVKKIEK